MHAARASRIKACSVRRARRVRRGPEARTAVFLVQPATLAADGSLRSSPFQSPPLFQLVPVRLPRPALTCNHYSSRVHARSDRLTSANTAADEAAHDSYPAAPR